MIAVEGLLFLRRFLKGKNMAKYLVEYQGRSMFLNSQTEYAARFSFASTIINTSPDLDLTHKYVLAMVEATLIPEVNNPQPTPVIPTMISILPVPDDGGATMFEVGPAVLPMNLPIAPSLGGGWTGDGKPSPENMPAERFGEEDQLDWWNPRDWDNFFKKGLDKLPDPGPGIPYLDMPWEGKYPGSNPLTPIKENMTEMMMMAIMMMGMRR